MHKGKDIHLRALKVFSPPFNDGENLTIYNSEIFKENDFRLIR